MRRPPEPADRADQPSEAGVVPELKRHCGLSDGNLSRHMQVLQDSGLVAVVKGYEDNRPHTAGTITPTGQQQVPEYLSVLAMVLRCGLARTKAPASAKPKTSPPLRC